MQYYLRTDHSIAAAVAVEARLHHMQRVLSCAWTEVQAEIKAYSTLGAVQWRVVSSGLHVQ